MYVFLLHVTSECSAFKTQQMQEIKVHVSIIIIIYTWILGKVYGTDSMYNVQVSLFHVVHV